LSPRSYDRILKVSRTIADLEGFSGINSAHVAGTVGYGSLLRQFELIPVDTPKSLARLGKFNIFWVGQGNDALKAPHHTRVEGNPPGIATPLKKRTRDSVANRRKRT
jgi:hypothetical protein